METLRVSAVCLYDPVTREVIFEACQLQGGPPESKKVCKKEKRLIYIARLINNKLNG